MPMKVKIKNYQAIKEASLEFEPGVTVIIGSSNNGKSSIIRSIEAAINNKGGSDFVNYDADSCEVTIEDLGHKIVWSKHKSSNKSFYNIDGQVLNKIGQKQLEEVGQLLNMSEVQVNNDKFRLNFWKQLDFPFLVGKTHYQLFDFISKSRDQEIISNLEDVTSSDIKNTNAELSDLNAKIDLKTKDIIGITEDIDVLKKFDVFDVSTFEALYIAIEKLERLIVNYKIIKEKVYTATKQFFEAKKKHEEFKKFFQIFKNELADFNKFAYTIDLFKKEKSIKETLLFLKKDIDDKKNKVKHINNIVDDFENNEKHFKKLSFFVNSYLKLLNTQNDHEQFINNVNQKIKDYNTELETFDVCPFCSSSLEKHEAHNG
jgi:exonuclease SbcC